MTAALGNRRVRFGSTFLGTADFDDAVHLVVVALAVALQNRLLLTTFVCTNLLLGTISTAKEGICILL